MATTPLTLSVSKPRFGRGERTEIRANFARDVLADMKAAYLADDRPWVVGFSGGKDSTPLVQLLYYMLARLPADQRRKHVYVLASDTRVEAPYISARIRKELGTIQGALLPYWSVCPSFTLSTAPQQRMVSIVCTAFGALLGGVRTCGSLRVRLTSTRVRSFRPTKWRSWRRIDA